MKRNRVFIALAAITSLLCAANAARADFTFQIEAAPVFADDASGAGRQLGPYATVYSATSTVATSLTSVNTGPLADWDANPPLNRGYDYWLKTQWGPYNELWNQMVIQLEGTVISGQGGMIDIMNNTNKYEQSVPVPPGKIWWRTSFKISALDIACPADPLVVTNSRIQHTILHDHDPATANDSGFSNILDDDGLIPVISSSFDASGLDVWFEFDGSLYWADALEDTSLRMVTFMEGEIPEPSTIVLLITGSGVLLACTRRKRRRR